MMLGKEHLGCKGTWRVPYGITEEQEQKANEFEDAAILTCSRCHQTIVDDSTSSRPDRYRKTVVPDQSVFEVGTCKTNGVS